MKKIILDLCGGTGAWSKYYAQDPSYKVYNLTLPDCDVTRLADLPSDVAYALQEGKVYGILAAPPCTEFSIARNDKTAKRARDMEKGMETVHACLKIIWWSQYKKFRKGEGLQFWCLENPATGYLQRFLGKPVMVFEPWQYGDHYSKKTALWGNFNEPKRTFIGGSGTEKDIYGTMVKYASDKRFKELKPVDPIYQKKLGIDTRTIRRSITPQGFAKAFYEANK